MTTPNTTPRKCPRRDTLTDSKPTRIASHCTACLWQGAMTGAPTCPACGDSLAVGRHPGFAKRSKPPSRGRHGEVSDETQRYVDAALRRNREDACR